jgi:hypothetical protein
MNGRFAPEAVIQELPAAPARIVASRRLKMVDRVVGLAMKSCRDLFGRRG